MALITRELLKMLRGDINQALAEVCNKHDIHIECGNASFDREGGSGSFKLLLSAIGADGTVVSREAQDFKDAAKLLGLDPSDLGRTFRSNGDTFTITGANLRARKLPILAERSSDGKTYKFPTDTIKMRLAQN